MKSALKLFLKQYLKLLAKLAILIHRPLIISIAGSSFKTAFKDRISRELTAAGMDVRTDFRSFNTEIGLPVAILRLPSGYGSYRAWLSIIIKAPKEIFKKMPKILVLELGVSAPGDMKYLLSIARPDIAVITDLNQRYLEKFKNMDSLVKEYRYLLKRMKSSGTAVINYDIPKLRQIAKMSPAKIISFGSESGADFQAIKIERRGAREKVTALLMGKEKEFEVDRPGKHQVFAFLAHKITQEAVQGLK